MIPKKMPLQLEPWSSGLRMLNVDYDFKKTFPDFKIRQRVINSLSESDWLTEEPKVNNTILHLINQNKTDVNALILTLIFFRISKLLSHPEMSRFRLVKWDI